MMNLSVLRFLNKYNKSDNFILKNIKLNVLIRKLNRFNIKKEKLSRKWISYITNKLNTRKYLKTQN